MQRTDQARRVQFGEPAFFLEKPAGMSVVIVDSAVHVESHVEQGGRGCVSVFWAAGAFPAFWPLGTVD